MSKKILVVAFAAVLGLSLFSTPASASDKDVIALQQQVTLLMGQIKDLQTAFATQTEIIKTLIGSNSDTVNKMTNTVAGVQTTLNGDHTVAEQRQGDISSQFRGITDQINELKAQLNQMNQTLKQVLQLQQTIQSPPPASPAGGGGGGDAAMGAAASGAPSGASAATAGSLSPAQLYEHALGDFMNSNLVQAQSEFANYVYAYPNEAHVGDALYYQGTIYFGKADYNDAITKYTEMLERFPESDNAPKAEMNKGEAYLKLGNRAAAITEFKSLVANYPKAAEARLASDELKSLRPPKN